MNTQLLSQIYGASMCPNMWPEVLDVCVDEVDAKSGALLRVDTLKSAGYSINVISKHVRNGLSEEDLKYWVTELSKYDEIGHRYGMTVPACTVFRDVDVNPDVSSLDNQPDYVFLREKLRIRRKLAARLIDNERYITTLGFQFPSEIETVSNFSISRMSDLTPHVAKSVEMGIVYEKLYSTYSKVLAAIDHVGIGMCIVEKNAQLIVANKEAERILESGQGIYLNKNKLIECSSESDTSQLRTAITKALLSVGEAGLKAERIIPIRAYPTHEPVLVEVTPLCDQLDEINVIEDTVLIQMIDVGCIEHCSTLAFAKAYGLTQAEEVVCGLIIEGLTNRQIAESRDTSVETTKSQIKSILAKANASSRIELIKKVLKTDPPVFGYDEE